jgi:hypothetical protein
MGVLASRWRLAASVAADGRHAKLHFNGTLPTYGSAVAMPPNGTLAATVEAEVVILRKMTEDNANATGIRAA